LKVYKGKGKGKVVSALN